MINNIVQTTTYYSSYLKILSNSDSQLQAKILDIQ
jgi:hypothetical protein